MLNVVLPSLHFCQTNGLIQDFGITVECCTHERHGIRITRVSPLLKEIGITYRRFGGRRALKTGKTKEKDKYAV
jgi:hypothetical protein